jgi:hypothetical protein
MIQMMWIRPTFRSMQELVGIFLNLIIGFLMKSRPQSGESWSSCNHRDIDEWVWLFENTLRNKTSSSQKVKPLFMNRFFTFMKNLSNYFSRRFVVLMSCFPQKISRRFVHPLLKIHFTFPDYPFCHMLSWHQCHFLEKQTDSIIFLIKCHTSKP